MKTFIKTNDRLVSLKNVSNINIITKSEPRIVFHLNYFIEIERDGRFKMISDYVYWDFISHSDFENAMAVLRGNEFIKSKFIEHRDGFVNIDEVSSIKFAEKKNRVIFNMSHPVTFVDYNGDDNVTSEFVYVNCNTREDFVRFKSEVENTIL